MASRYALYVRRRHAINEVLEYDTRASYSRSTLRVLKVLIFPKQRLEGLLVLLVVLKSVDIHGVVDN